MTPPKANDVPHEEEVRQSRRQVLVNRVVGVLIQ
jgi:hypothetical protein